MNMLAILPHSMSGHRCTGSKSTNFYSATKFAVRALTEGARMELRQEKSRFRISVSSLLAFLINNTKEIYFQLI